MAYAKTLLVLGLLLAVFLVISSEVSARELAQEQVKYHGDRHGKGYEHDHGKGHDHDHDKGHEHGKGYEHDHGKGHDNDHGKGHGHGHDKPSHG